jgi:hypothetical protein
MQLSDLHPTKRSALLLHPIFVSIYLLLFVRAGMSFYEGPIDLLRLPNDSLATLIIKRLCGNLYAPFFGLMIFSPENNADLIVAIVFAILFYALIHYGMFMNVSIERSGIMMNKVLAFCRAVFFLAGTLLILLIITRMSVMLYQDIAYGHANWSGSAAQEINVECYVNAPHNKALQLTAR